MNKEVIWNVDVVCNIKIWNLFCNWFMDSGDRLSVRKVWNRCLGFDMEMVLVCVGRNCIYSILLKLVIWPLALGIMWCPVDKF